MRSVCNTSQPDDLSPTFILEDVRERCLEQYAIPESHLNVRLLEKEMKTRETIEQGTTGETGTKLDLSSGMESIDEAIDRAAREAGAAVVVVGNCGSGGVHVGRVGPHAIRATHRLQQTLVVVHPYSAPLQPDGMRVFRFLAIVNSERPSSTSVVRASMQMMSYWHVLTVLVLLGERQAAKGQNALKENMERVLRVAGVNGTVHLQPVEPNKTPEQLILRVAEADRANYVVLVPHILSASCSSSLLDVLIVLTARLPTHSFSHLSPHSFSMSHVCVLRPPNRCCCPHLAY